MCGIAGAVGTFNEPTLPLVEKMLRAMHHRGPDQSGIWSASEQPNGTVLGHQRLSIIDLSEAGRQPMRDAAGGNVICYNGEFYNYQPVRAELEGLGHTFRSSSDTEVFLAALAQWGDAAVERVRGMFATAWWSEASQSVTLFRDRLGIKPLYYLETDGGILFASEIRALLATGKSSRNINPQALDAYLWHGFVPGPHTIVDGIKLLDPGTSVTIDTSGRMSSPRNYWRLPRKQQTSSTPADATEKVRETLREAVRIRMVSDVPLGVFLSGGIDSSLVAMLAQDALSDPVKSFNIRFEEAGYDESEYARSVASQLGTDHTEITLSQSAFVTGLDDAIASLDQPTFDAINTYFVSKSVKEAGLTVALSGAGGDELFGGYASFRDIPKAMSAGSFTRFLPDGILRMAGGLGSRFMAGAGSEIPPQTRFGKLQDALFARGDLLNLYQLSYSLFTRDFHRTLTQHDVPDMDHGLYPLRRQWLAETIHGRTALDAISQLEQSTFISERLLRDTDCTSMASSLEVRVPLLDHVVLEEVVNLTDDQRFAAQKKFMREMLSGPLPADLFTRPKAGFELPMEVWCRNQLQEDMDTTFADLGLVNSLGLDCETVARTWRAFKKGGAGLYWSRVWALYVLLRWCREHKLSV